MTMTMLNTNTNTGDDDTSNMLVSLTSNDLSTSVIEDDHVSPSRVGGKASSLAKLYAIKGLSNHVPKSFALTVDFFQPWIQKMKQTVEYKSLLMLQNDDDNVDGNGDGNGTTTNSTTTTEELLCEKLQKESYKLTLSKEQSNAIHKLVNEMKNSNSSWDGVPNNLVAVRSSAPEEDGTDYSFAGAYDTCLGIGLTFDELKNAIHTCFASLWNYRVLHYKQMNATANTSSSNNGRKTTDFIGGFAVVVMEMIDSQIAGVAFTANPLNSDRDELVIDSSWGLGESVVDGSVTADRYIIDKIKGKLIKQTLGVKGIEKRLDMVSGQAGSSGGGGGVIEHIIKENDPRRTISSLTKQQLHELTKLVCIVEDIYGMPMDIEWAFITSKHTDNYCLDLKLLQARPITTLFCLDTKMMTQPGERRKLYFDFNIISEATTTSPFTTMDLDFYCKVSIVLIGPKSLREAKDKNWKLYSESSDMPMFNSSTRQYCNMSHIFIYASTQSMSKIVESGAHTGTLEDFLYGMCDAIRVSIQEECGAISGIVTGYKKFDEKRRDEKLSKEIREEYEALCGGYVGDELMETNIEMYHLAKTLPLEVWNQYDHESMKSLAIRIETNLAEMGKSSTNNSNIDLPIEFLESWKLFMHKFGYDGQDQLFMSCPRYDDSPEFLLGKMRMNALGEVKDPYITQQERVAKRRAVQTNHEEDAANLNKLFHPFALSKIKKRNEYLEHVMWMRNSPKMRLANVIGIIRAELLRIQDKFIDSGRLEEKNDIFHLTIDEIDKALIDNDQQQQEQLQLMDIVRPRKVVYERALRATICPLLVDSRCRILQPDPPTFKDGEEPPEGTLIGSAVAPGIAIGTVRIIDHPNEKFENGEVLCATVTGPAWTPLFASASAVVLQIGGVLQHGALCAREYGKPAVSNINIHTELKNGMKVSVDGNTGIVKIMSSDNDDE
ncbi:pyruvate phosphate dikinase [Fragilariopsis cylindrus CCMP1102]|uniref:Pyruvate phosphate dikinase n=1 Tax=Fragilariopsis cylindrus CCMP1102 TaxID=635003 RepID=A0A1E7ET70_9STRA|nr:pyruvate phosphate dikinase [Fragilariopsis cylindrus CCMP1102]|eukprot:OEU08763.1 pyruvate phosphate dikinase [Fragilariopsis cylindrus CCMP1102]